jgi:hypothetical protein
VQGYHRCVRSIFGGTTEIQKEIIARSLTRNSTKLLPVSDTMLGEKLELAL